MKPRRLLVVILVSLAGAAALAQNEKKDDAPEKPIPKDLATTQKQVSYGIGLSVGRSLKGERIDIDTDTFIKGLLDALGDKEPALSVNQIRTAMQAYQTELADKAKKVGEAFLAANKQKQGVTTLPSGVQYKVLKPGNGPRAKATDVVVTHYKGTLTDGTVFDSSYGGKPATFGVNQVIAGWTEVLQLMPVGAKWQVVIPADKAYGASGSPPAIGPHETLVFEIELLEIKPTR